MKKILLLGLLVFSGFLCKAQNPCDKIEVNKDDVRGYTSYDTPYKPGLRRQIWLTKIVEPGKPSEYYLHILEMESVGKVVNGAYLLLANGKRIAKPNIEVTLNTNPNSSDDDVIPVPYIQQVDIKLTNSDVIALKTSPIKKYAFSCFSAMEIDGNELYHEFLCMVKK